MPRALDIFMGRLLNNEDFSKASGDKYFCQMIYKSIRRKSTGRLAFRASAEETSAPPVAIP